MAYAVLDDAIYPHKDHGRNNAHKYMFVHVRVANLLGSFYELFTLKVIYTGCTAAVCRLFLRSSPHERITLVPARCSHEILSSMRHVLKTTSSANNTLAPDLLPLPSTNATYVHVRVANLLGSFYELFTLKVIYTGCTAAVDYQVCCLLYTSPSPRD